MMRLAVVLATFLTVLLVRTGTYADEPAAELVQEAQEALDAGEFADAEKAFREALEADARHLPARYGLAQALLGAERAAEGLDELRRAVRWAEATDDVPDAWRQTLTKARLELRALDPVSKALEALLQSGAKDLLKFAKSKHRKSPAEADHACRLAARLDRGNAKAAGLLQDFKALPHDRWVGMYHGHTDDWGRLASPPWNPTADHLECVAGMKAFHSFTDDRVEGDFDMRLEVRIVEKSSPAYAVGLLGAYGGEQDSMMWCLSQDQIVLDDRRGQGLGRPTIFNMHIESYKPKIDVEDFNLFELRFRGSEVQAWLNGILVHTTSRGSHRVGGRLGLICVYATAEFRRMEIRQR